MHCIVSRNSFTSFHFVSQYVEHVRRTVYFAVQFYDCASVPKVNMFTCKRWLDVRDTIVAIQAITVYHQIVNANERRNAFVR